MPDLREAVARGRIARLSRLLSPGGTLVVSVPAEIGVPVIIKQIVRTIAGRRNVGYYSGTTPFGFNWRVLHERLSRQFDLTRVVASLRLGPGLATQVWFICRVRKARLREPAGGDARYGEAGLQ